MNNKILYKTFRISRGIKSIVHSRLGHKSPVSLTHVVTDFCNFKCEKCNVWILQKHKNRDNELSTNDVLDALDKAADAGIISYTIWGGEPLIRDDIGQILEHAYNKKMFTSLITNGYFINKYHKEINQHLDYLIVSIDGIGDVHDEAMGVPGSYDRILEGVKLVKDKTNVLFNCVITNKNFDKIDELIELVKELEVKLVFEPIDKFTGVNEHLLLNDNQLLETFNKLLSYKKKTTLIVNSEEYLKCSTIKKKFICHSPKVFTTLKANGDIYSCQGRLWGNIKESDFKNVLRSQEYAQFCVENESCNKCAVSCVVETSLAYSLNPRYFIDKLKSIYN